MACPFLSRLPAKFVKNYTSSLVKVYADHCPVASRSMSTMVPQSSSSESKSCPFLSDAGQKDNLVKKADTLMAEDVFKIQKGKILFWGFLWKMEMRLRKNVALNLKGRLLEIMSTAIFDLKRLLKL